MLDKKVFQRYNILRFGSWAPSGIALKVREEVSPGSERLAMGWQMGSDDIAQHVHFGCDGKINEREVLQTVLLACTENTGERQVVHSSDEVAWISRTPRKRTRLGTGHKRLIRRMVPHPIHTNTRQQPPAA